MSPTDPITLPQYAGPALILLALACALTIWVLRRRRCRSDFDWRPPDNFAATDQQDYSFCSYENRFAYALGSLVDEPTTTTKPTHAATAAPPQEPPTGNEPDVVTDVKSLSPSANR